MPAALPGRAGTRIPTGKEPDDSDPAAQAGYWCEVNCQRWLLATQHEHASGLAVCDDDPLKLHYCWSLMRIGAASPERWARKVAANLAALTEGRLGFADLVLVSIPPVEEPRRRRDSDPTRRRRNFELRAQLEVDRVVPASGNLMVGQQQIWLGPARTGLPVVIWVDTERLHVLGVDGGRIKTTASRLSQRDLARLRPDGGR